jgi:hypothetical protein
MSSSSSSGTAAGLTTSSSSGGGSGSEVAPAAASRSIVIDFGTLKRGAAVQTRIRRAVLGLANSIEHEQLFYEQSTDADNILLFDARVISWGSLERSLLLLLISLCCH